MVKKGTKDCKAFVTSSIPKWSLCNSLGGQVCAAGPACPVNSISATSFGAKDKNEKVVSVGSSKLYLSSIQPSYAVTKLTVEIGKPCANFSEISASTAKIYQIFENSKGCSGTTDTKYSSEYKKLFELGEDLFVIYG